MSGHVPLLSPRVRAAVEDYDRRLREAFGTRLRHVSLFGSWARGDARSDSDIDVLVLIDEATRSDWRDAVYLSADTSVDHDVVVSASVYSTAQMERLRGIESPFAKSVARDEVVFS